MPKLSCGTTIVVDYGGLFDLGRQAIARQDASLLDGIEKRRVMMRHLNLQRVEWRPDIPTSELEPFNTSSGTDYGILHDTGFSAADVLERRVNWPECDIKVLRNFVGNENMRWILSELRTALVTVRGQLIEAGPRIEPTTPKGLDQVCQHILKSENLRDCVVSAASWLCEWIDFEMRVSGELKPEGFNHAEYCAEMADSMEAWSSENEELAAWAWSTGAEIIALYERCTQLDDSALTHQVCSEIDEPGIEDKEAYARHLFASALAFLHGWTHQPHS